MSEILQVAHEALAMAAAYREAYEKVHNDFMRLYRAAMKSKEIIEKLEEENARLRFQEALQNVYELKIAEA